MPNLQSALRPQDAVLQYFVTGRYVVVFYFTQRHFDWVLVDAVREVQRDEETRDAPTAHAVLCHVIRACDSWLKGENTPEHVARAAPLGRLLLPDDITEQLCDSRNTHVRVIPHDVLYRLPFGRFAFLDATLTERFSLSVHATAGLAAESASHRSRPRPRRSVGYVFDPSLGSVERERARIASGVGRFLGIGALVSIDTTQVDDTDTLLEEIVDLDVLHMACHGNRPFGRREAFLELGTGRWKLSQLANLHMRQCALTILQSCWVADDRGPVTPGALIPDVAAAQNTRWPCPSTGSRG